MLYYLDGTVALIEPGLAVIDCGGVGFSCSTTTYTLASLKTGTRARLYTYCNILADTFDIYGFFTKDERDCFVMLACKKQFCLWNVFTLGAHEGRKGMEENEF